MNDLIEYHWITGVELRMLCWAKKHRIPVSIAAGLMAAAAFPFIAVFPPHTAHLSEGVIGLLFAVISVWIVSCALSRDSSLNPSGCLIAGILSSGFLVVGSQIYLSLTFALSLSNLLSSLLRIVLLLPLSVSVAFILFDRIQNCSVALSESLEFRQKPLLLFLSFWAVLLVLWLPAFLAYYPGIFGYDMHNETHQAFTGIYNTFQPLLYTLFFKGSYSLGIALFKNPAGAVALFLFAQMVILGALYSGVCVILSQRFHLPRFLVCGFVLFFGLVPNHAILSVSSTKDALFTGFFVLLTAQLYCLCADPDSFLKSFSRAFCLVLTVILTALLRNNLIYAFLLLIPFCFLVKRSRLKVVALLLASLLLALGARSGISSVLHADGGQRVELLSVPIQQVSRVYSLHSSELSDEQRSSITEFLPEESLKDYWPLLADPVKDHCLIGDGMPSILGFLKVWASLLPAYFQDYTDQFLIMTLGYWYPEETWHDIVYSCYHEPDTEESLGYLYTGFMENIIPGVERDSKSVVFYNYYQWYAHENGFESIPVLSLFLSPGFSCWVMILFLCYALSARRMDLFVPSLLSFIMWLTLLLGPCMIVRYTYPFLACWPVYIGVAVRRSPVPEESFRISR